MSGKHRLVIGMSGASGAVLGLRCLELVSELEQVECHLVVTPAAARTLTTELDGDAHSRAISLADVVHPCGDVGAAIASGSFRCHGMIVAPCSMRTLSAIAYSLSDNLLTRTADVMLKERRRLVLIGRETPLHAGHLEAMLKVTNHGAIILPPVPAFYTRPASLDEVVTQIAAHALELAGVEMSGVLVRWDGNAASST
ncbi:MAG: hypothetical protein APF80_10110 [Alphaproteobacteria bacterium BRH_c36]|nr:MAG: hypothetical protein APF80_10110 [Alphaproteobacteria bacterium BRH_c36]